MALREQKTGLGQATSRTARTHAAASPTMKPRITQADSQAAPTAKHAPAGAIDLLNRPRQVQRTTTQASQAQIDDTGYDDAWPGRLPSSSRRYYASLAPQNKPLPPGEYLINGRRVIVDNPQVVRRRAHAITEYEDEEERAPKRKRGRLAGLRAHWLLLLGLGMILALSGFYGAEQLANAWNLHQQDVTFGRPRTYQFDALLPGDSSQFPTHFICINLNRHVQVYEEPAGDASKTIVYNGPVMFGDGQDLTPVLGRVTTINGQPVFILYIQDQTIVYFYSGGKFVLATQQQLATIHQLPPPPTP